MTRASLFDARDGSLRVSGPAAAFDATLEVPGDKSISHRSVLLASLGPGRVEVENLLESADVMATVAAVRRLGCPARRLSPGHWTISGRGVDGYREADRPLDCKNSGTTARLLTGLLAASPFFSVLTGDASLRRRPMGRVVRPLELAGAVILGRDGGRLLPLAIQGKRLEAFEYSIPEASAQVKTALLLAALKSHGTSRITQQSVTRDHTEHLFEYLGVAFRRNGNTVELDGPIEPQSRDLAVPGDPSSAAFFAVAALMVPGSRVTVRGVCLNPTRIGFIRVLGRMGARIRVRPAGSFAGEEAGELAVEFSELAATEVAAEEIPSLVDEVPILAVAASQARGTTWFRGVQELRAKESDRLAALTRELGAMGAEIEEVGDDLAVHGPRRLAGTAVGSHADHRMAMSLSVAALAATGTTEIAGHECVKISFPDFYERLERMLGSRAG